MTWTILFFDTPENPDLQGEMLAVFREGVEVPDVFGPRIRRLTWHQETDPETGVVVQGRTGWQVVKRNKPRPDISREIVRQYMRSTAANPFAFNVIPGEMRWQGVAAIVLAHARPRWLADAVEDLYRQTRRPDEVVIVVNGPDPDTMEVAYGFCRRSPRAQVVVINPPIPIGAARQEGFKRTNGRYVLFADDDNRRSRDFIEKGMAALKSARNIGFAYPRIAPVGEIGNGGKAAPARPFDPALLTRCNYISNSSLIKREAFEEVDGWEADRPRYEDWSLWLRISQRGWIGAPHDGILYYRQHEGQRHRTHPVSDAEGYAAIMREVLRTAIFTPFTGRYECFDEAFDCIAALMDRHPRLVWYPLDNSKDPAFRSLLYHRLDDARLWERVRFMVDDHEPIKIVPQRGGSAVGQICARMWNRVLTEIPEELVFSVEHDLAVPDPALLDTLYTGLDQDTALAGAFYRRGRFVGCNQTLDGDDRIHAFPAQVEEKAKVGEWMELDMLGHACCLIRRNWLRAEGVVMCRMDNVAGVWPGGDGVMAAQLKERGMKTKGIMLPEGTRPLHHHMGVWM